MAGITLAQAMRVFSSELGCGTGDREVLIDAITEALEYFMLSGGGDILREWVLPVAHNQKTTLPEDLETPVKYKFSDMPNAKFGTFYSAYLTYSSQGVLDMDGYWDWNPKLLVGAARVSTQFQPPPQGVRIVAVTDNEKDVGKKIMVGGNCLGMKIAPTFNGSPVTGELLTIYHIDDPDKKYGQYRMTEVTSVTKEPTLSYVMLSGIDEIGEMYHLSFYHPDDVTPRYKQIELIELNWNSAWGGNQKCPTCIHILGRTNPTIRYSRDEDILPISSPQLLKYLAKRARYDESGDFDTVAVMEQRIQGLIRKFVAYQQAPNRSESVNLKNSGHSLTNM